MAPRIGSAVGNAPSTPVKQMSARSLRTPTSATRSATTGAKATTPLSARRVAMPTSARKHVTTPRGGTAPSTPKRAGGASGENIVVAVRVRDFLPREERSRLALLMKDETTELTYRNAQRPFTFDHCFWSIRDTEDTTYNIPYASQKDVYEKLGSPVIDNALKGFNSSIIAYGQTGSGKSYSVFGPQGSLGSGSEHEGLIPRVCKELFERIAEGGDGADSYLVQASMLELYKEQVFDLLNKKVKLVVRSDSNGGFQVPGRTQREVKCYKEIEDLLKRGEVHKTYAATALNDRSSRAHTLFELEIKGFTTDRYGQSVTTVSKLTLCDLAGSERCKDAKTEVGGKEFAEACKINMSLLCLGKCVETVHQRGSSALVTEFRASALTKLLKDSIGGNSKTVILVTLAPSEVDSHNTHCALLFADRAKCLKTHAVINAQSVVDKKNQRALIDQKCQQKIEEIKIGFELEQQQAELEEKKENLESERSRLQKEKEIFDRQKHDMVRKGLSEADKLRLEQREIDLTRRLQTAQTEYDDVRSKAVNLETKIYADSQTAQREKEEYEDRIANLIATLEELKIDRDEERVTWEEDNDKLFRQYHQKLEEQKESHISHCEKKEQRFLEERKTYVEKMMQSVAKLQKDMQEKEEKWRRREEEWKVKLHDATSSGSGRLHDVQNKLSEKTIEFERNQDELIASKWSQEEGLKRINSLYQELTEAKLLAQSYEDHIVESHDLLQDAFIATNTKMPDLPEEAMSPRIKDPNSDALPTHPSAVAGLVYTKALVESFKTAKGERDDVFTRLSQQQQKSNAMQSRFDDETAEEKERFERLLREAKRSGDEDRLRQMEARSEAERNLEKEKEKSAESLEAQQTMERRLGTIVAKHAEEVAEMSQQHKEALESIHTCHADALNAMRNLHRQEVDDLSVQLTTASKAKHNLAMDKDTAEAALQRERELAHRVEEDLRSQLEDTQQEKAAVAAETSSLQARLLEQQSILQEKTRSLQEAQGALHTVSTDTTLYEKRFGTAKKQLEVCVFGEQFLVFFLLFFSKKWDER